MRRALHLGVKKALGVVRSHYEVNLEAVASGYVVPEGVEDEVAMEHVDALAADAAETLTRTSWSSCSPTLLTSASPKPEMTGHWAILVEVLESGPYGRVNKQVFCLDVQTLVDVNGVFGFACRAVLFFLCLGEFGLGEFDFVSNPLGRRQERRAVSSRRRRLSLARASFPLGHPRPT
jgi:hypothetical protein